MLLTITTTHQPATDLGYLLHKNPGRLQTAELSMGKAHIFYPEATPARCTAALLLEVDPVALVRNRKGPGGDAGTLKQYVNDRPYVASSFLSVAIAQVFGSAMGGRSKDRPELAETPIPLEAKIAVLPCRGGEPLLRRIFEPVGYTVTAQGYQLDATFQDWGESPYFTVTLQATCRLSDLLRHLYVLVPVMDSRRPPAGTPATAIRPVIKTLIPSASRPAGKRFLSASCCSTKPSVSAIVSVATRSLDIGSCTPNSRSTWSMPRAMICRHSS